MINDNEVNRIIAIFDKNERLLRYLDVLDRSHNETDLLMICSMSGKFPRLYTESFDLLLPIIEKLHTQHLVSRLVLEFDHNECSVDYQEYISNGKTIQASIARSIALLIKDCFE